MKRLAVILCFAFAACSHGQPVAYRPVAYGEPGHCYYAQDFQEALALQRAGLCPPDWQPTLMPTYWHQRYWNYYSSPAYYSVYVPAPARTVYVRSERGFGSTNRQAINTEAKQATYKGSNGKTVPASKIGAAKYGGGNRFGPAGTKFGGGDRAKPAGTKAKAPSPNGPKPPTAKPPTAKPPAPRAPASPPRAPVRSPSGGGRSFGGGGRK
jgi:hypothetical protein